MFKSFPEDFLIFIGAANSLRCFIVFGIILIAKMLVSMKRAQLSEISISLMFARFAGIASYIAFMNFGWNWFAFGFDDNQTSSPMYVGVVLMVITIILSLVGKSVGMSILSLFIVPIGIMSGIMDSIYINTVSIGMVFIIVNLLLDMGILYKASKFAEKHPIEDKKSQESADSEFKNIIKKFDRKPVNKLSRDELIALSIAFALHKKLQSKENWKKYVSDALNKSGIGSSDIEPIKIDVDDFAGLLWDSCAICFMLSLRPEFCGKKKYDFLRQNIKKRDVVFDDDSDEKSAYTNTLLYLPELDLQKSESVIQNPCEHLYKHMIKKIDDEVGRNHKKYSDLTIPECDNITLMMLHHLQDIYSFYETVLISRYLDTNELRGKYFFYNLDTNEKAQFAIGSLLYEPENENIKYENWTVFLLEKFIKSAPLIPENIDSFLTSQKYVPMDFNTAVRYSIIEYQKYKAVERWDSRREEFNEVIRELNS